jgi:hypothetical protein
MPRGRPLSLGLMNFHAYRQLEYLDDRAQSTSLVTTSGECRWDFMGRNPMKIQISFARRNAMISALCQILFLWTFVAGTSGATMVTRKEDENDLLRLCTPSDVVGSWVLQDQILTKSIRESAAGRKALQSSPFLVKNQVILISPDNHVRYFQYEGLAFTSEDDRVEKERSLVRHLGDEPSRARLRYEVRNDGRLVLTNEAGEPDSALLCNTVIGSFRYHGRQGSVLPGDLILGVLTPVKEGCKLLAENVFRKRD